MNRIKYFFYYLFKTNWTKFFSFMRYAGNVTSQSDISLLADAVISSFRYNISLLDYFYFRFYEKNRNERLTWAGTGTLYEYQLSMNPKDSREVLENKISFLNRFKPFLKRSFASIAELQEDENRIEQLLANPSGKVVLKGALGQVGAEVEVVKTAGFSPQSLLQYMFSKKFDLIEEYVVQHPVLMELSPSGLNTLRIFTQLYNGKVEWLGARLRISVNSPVDNMAAGNLAAPLHMDTGVVSGPAIYSDITKKDETVHPITGKTIVGFRVPFWPETLEMITRAALHVPENKSVGWDIAITANGPELIEGNHNWCKLLWQLPVKQGLKPMLEKYMVK